MAITTPYLFTRDGRLCATVTLPPGARACVRRSDVGEWVPIPPATENSHLIEVLVGSVVRITFGAAADGGEMYCVATEDGLEEVASRLLKGFE